MGKTQQRELFRNGTPKLSGRDTDEITFKGKLNLPVHRWMRLTASFSPHLASDILHHFGVEASDKVVDPFCGVGTVPLVAQQVGASGCGVEINPVLAFVAQTKLRTDYRLPELRQDVKEFVDELTRRVGKVADVSIENIEGIQWPPIYNAQRWWQAEPMKVLLLARAIAEEDYENYTRDFLRVGLASVLIELSDAGAGRVSLSFLDDPPSISIQDAVRTIKTSLHSMLDDLEETASWRSEIAADTEYTVVEGDSRDLSSALPNQQFDVLLTSPPYPNRFSYVRETRPHLYFFELFTEAASAGKLDMETIGGTWGRATSSLEGETEEAEAAVQPSLEPELGRLRESKPKMANYLVRYFNNMWTHFQSLDEAMRRRSRVVYVVGNTKLAGEVISTDEIIAELLEKAGFGLDSVEKMRKRQSRKGLYEATVFASRS